MKMFKVVAAMLAIMLLISGCGCTKNETNDKASSETNVATDETQAETIEGEETPSVATGETEEASTDDGKISIDLSNVEQTPKYYWAVTAEGDKNLLYHNEACPTLTEAATPINLGVAQSIGLRQCPECKPEKYEGYAE